MNLHDVHRGIKKNKKRRKRWVAEPAPARARPPAAATRVKAQRAGSISPRRRFRAA